MKTRTTFSIDRDVADVLERMNGKRSSAVNEAFRILYSRPDGTSDDVLEEWRKVLVLRVNAITGEQERRARTKALTSGTMEPVFDLG